MKPYILNYSNTIEIQKNELYFDEESQINQPSNADNTTQTFTIESSDEDFVILSNGTKITETIESSDEDYVYFSESTLVTNIVESSDADEFYLNSTMITRTVEDSDPDELCSSNLDVTKAIKNTELSDVGFHCASYSTLITKSLEPSDDEYLSH